MKRFLVLPAQLLGCILIGYLVSTCLLLLLSSPPVQPNIGAVVRLSTFEEDLFFCSGTVISEKYLITAAHCVAPPECIMPGLCMPGPSKIRITSQLNKKTIATVAGYNKTMDQALLKGDFKDWPQATLETHTKAVIYSMSKHNLLTCGYPLSGELYCEKVKSGVQYIFYFAFDGHLFPGMSGGPLFDIETGNVVGTNYGANDNKIIIAGTEEEWSSTFVNPNK